jgi:hypothetical protein
MLGHWYGLLFANDEPPPATKVGGVKDRPKKRLRQSAFIPRPPEIMLPVVRSDDDELLILMALGAL